MRSLFVSSVITVAAAIIATFSFTPVRAAGGVPIEGGPPPEGRGYGVGYNTTGHEIFPDFFDAAAGSCFVQRPAGMVDEGADSLGTDQSARD